MATILVVEDEPVVMRVVQATLSPRWAHGFKASSVTAGRAVAEGCLDAIDLLIADHLLSDGRGREIAEHLLKKRPDFKVPHISGYPLAAILADDSLTPGVTFLAKPLLPMALSAAVDALLCPPPQSACANG